MNLRSRVSATPSLGCHGMPALRYPERRPHLPGYQDSCIQDRDGGRPLGRGGSVTDLQRRDIDPADDALAHIDIAFAARSRARSGPDYSERLLAQEPPAATPWYIRADALPPQTASGLWQTSGAAPAEPVNAQALERALDPIRPSIPLAAVPTLELVPETEPEAPSVSPGESKVPWFIRVDPPKSSLVGHLPALAAPAKLEGAVVRAADARKRAVSVRRRLRAEVTETRSGPVLPQTAAALPISVLGCGAGSLALASAFALSGHTVAVVAQDDDTLIALETGEERYPEPDLHHLHESASAAGGLRFTVDRRAVSGATVIVLHDADDEAAISALLPALGLGSLVVVVAPLAAGMRALERRIRPTGAELAWVPLLTRDGMVVSDLLHPRGLIFGLPRDPLTAADVRGTLEDLYAFALGTDDGAAPSVIDVDYATADLARAAGLSLLLAALDAD